MHARLLRREPDWPVLRIRPLGARRFVDSDSLPMKVSTTASASTPPPKKNALRAWQITMVGLNLTHQALATPNLET